MTTLYSHERYSYEEVIEEIKLPLFSADASSSQHRSFSVLHGPSKAHGCFLAQEVLAARTRIFSLS
jgi:hypothetical protein